MKARRAWTAFLGLAHKQAQKGPEVGQDLPHVVPCAAEDYVLRVSDHSLEEVSSEKSVALHVTQCWFDGGPSS
jgi:hypothetical protein